MKMFKFTPLFVCLLAATSAFAAVDKGEWTLSQSEDPGKIRLSLQSEGSGNHSFSSSSDWTAADLKGLDISTAAKHDVHFTITRDAGSIEAEGFCKDGSGAGLFTFHGNSQYSAAMAKLGFPDVTSDDLFAYTLHDVSLDFVRQVKAAGINGLDTHKLIAFRIHGVTPQLIRDIHAAGVDENDADKLIAFRIHGVSPEFIKSLKSAGIGTTNSDKLIAFRIHGVSPEFVSQLSHLGFQHPDPEKLIACRIHGVTPEYIEKMRGRGMQNQSLDQLINLRIHGID